MKVLVIGDEHTYGYGLPVGKLSYLGHFIRLISRTGQDVSVEAYAHLTRLQTAQTLAQLPLNRYDLIILQFNHNLLQPTSALVSEELHGKVSALPHPFAQMRSAISNWYNPGKTSIRDLLAMLWPLQRLRDISALFNHLRPYRHNVLIVTPLPQRTKFNQWLQKRSRSMLLTEADKQLFSVFDSDLVIQPREEYFLPNDAEHLSAVSHELLGRVLFDFYQSAPTIVTIQSTRRD